MRASRFDIERTVNMYLEISSVPTTKDDQPSVLLGTPGLRLLHTLPTGPMRAAYTASDKIHSYVVYGNSVYLLTSLQSTPLLVGILSTNSGLVSIADNGIQVVFVDGVNGYYTTLADVAPTITQILSVNFYPASIVTFQDGYFIFTETNSQYFFLSDLYTVNFLPLNQSAKAGYPDNLVGAISNNRLLYLLGQNTCEVWYDQGASGSTPFVRQDGRFSMTGCLSAASIQKLFNTIMWVGANPEGSAVVYMMESDQPVRVSNHAVEFSIQNATSDFSTCSAYTWQIEGHYFYVLNVPGLNTTWVYDLATEQWFEQQSDINGITGRHIAQCHCLIQNTHVVGDYSNGNLYVYDFNTYTDNGKPILRIRQSPHIAKSLNRLFYKLFELDFSPGVGLITGTLNQTVPKITLEVSDDGGLTFKTPKNASIGKIGKYLTRARWGMLGSGRDRVFRVSCSDPIKFDLLSAQLDVEIGNA